MEIVKKKPTDIRWIRSHGNRLGYVSPFPCGTSGNIVRRIVREILTNCALLQINTMQVNIIPTKNGAKLVCLITYINSGPLKTLLLREEKKRETKL